MKAHYTKARKSGDGVIIRWPEELSIAAGQRVMLEKLGDAVIVRPLGDVTPQKTSK